ncbi:MAG TPA: hypothetical protein VLC09_18470 [Polyangiaceae bacterium]|nr:hypothetical protein [Polyangiaceae bacterium]
MSKTNVGSESEGAPLRRLLIVQHNEFAASSMRRFLAASFDEVRVVNASSGVFDVLREFAPTHLVCGQELGTDSETGATLIPSWRAECPSLICVVLATGALQLPSRLPGVDAVVHKPATPSAWLSVLAA